jgi:hypothetical protein
VNISRLAAIGLAALALAACASKPPLVPTVPSDPSTATAWLCSSKRSGPVQFVISGNELKKHDRPGLSKEQRDALEQTFNALYTFLIVINNQYGLIAVSPMVKQNSGHNTSGIMVIINKETGKYLEALLSADPKSGRALKNQNHIERGTCAPEIPDPGDQQAETQRSSRDRRRAAA